ncbi:MAG: GNA1162 family protein [Desulfovibrionaceae bacterium]
MNRTRKFFLALLALAALVAGCASPRPLPPVASGQPDTVDAGQKTAVPAQSGSFSFFSGDYEVSERFAAHPPESVAVLPFTGNPAHWRNVPEDLDPPAILRRAFYNQLASLRFRDLELADVDARLARSGAGNATTAASLLANDPARLRRILGVDAVVTAEVTHFDRLYFGIFSQVAVGCRVTMTDLASGEVVWRAEQVSRGAGGGPSISPFGLAMSALQSIWNMREVQLLRETDEIFREMVSTLAPHLTGQPATLPLAPPVIDLFVCLKADKTFSAGSPATFRLVGDPGARVSVDLVRSATAQAAPFRSGIALDPLPRSIRKAVHRQTLDLLKERYARTGHVLGAELVAAVDRELAAREIYEGTYVPAPGEEGYGLTARATLDTPDGQRAVSFWSAQAINVDARPPDAPGNLTAQPLPNGLDLAWPAVADAVAYEVETAPEANATWTMAHTTSAPRARLEGLPDFSTIRLRVRAVDAAGNRGEASPVLAAAILPDPDLANLPALGPELGGTLDTPVLLTREGGPYTVRATLVVGPGGALHLGPGAVLRFAPGTALRVEGGDIFAHGTAHAPVRFTPWSATGMANALAQPGAFEGLVLVDAGQALLRHLRIDHATIGIRVQGCAPVLDGVVVTHTSQAGLLLQNGARPTMTCSLVRAGQGMGGVVVEGAGVDPHLYGNSFVDNEPFQVQNYAPVAVDLGGNHWEGDGAERFLGSILREPRLATPPDCAPSP